MSTSRPFSYNTGSLIEGTIQVGTLAVGTTISGFTNNPKFWEGPDEELGYVIAAPQSGNTQPTPVSGVTASVQFFRTTSFAENEFISLSQYVSNNFNTPQTFSSGTDASTWLTANGYWNSWIPLTLGWDDIANADLLVGDASNVADWNTFFDLPTNGTPFALVIVTGNTVNLYGGYNINLKANLFEYNGNLVSVVDGAEGILSASTFCFQDCSFVSEFNLPALTSAGNGCFRNCYMVSEFNLPALTSAGSNCFRESTINANISIEFNLPSLRTVGSNCFQDCGSVTTFNLPLLISSSFACFRFCSNVTTFNLPLLRFTSGNDFDGCSSVTTFNIPSLIFADSTCFRSCSSVTTFNLPLLTNSSSNCFQECLSVTTFNLPSCTNLGGTTGNNNVFNGISGISITLTIPESRMTCNSGNPDGDIQYLQANNTVTVITT